MLRFSDCICTHPQNFKKDKKKKNKTIEHRKKLQKKKKEIRNSKITQVSEEY